MRRSSEPQERAQFTVAELLARYGDPAPVAAGRRHRRADDDRDDGGAADTAAGRGAAQPVAAPPVMDRNWTVSSAESTQPRLTGPTLQQWAPAVGPPSAVAAPMPVAPPALPRRSPLSRTAPPLDGPVTEQLPRLDQAPVSSANWSSRRPASANPDTSQPPAGLRTVSRAIAEPTENAIVADEETAQQAGSPLWEWAVMVSQVGIGIVGGAALWLICEWLWQRIPVVALVVALAVITGLVWVVRRVRGAEDLQTTVVAVLVGLFVTVSPAALLLVGR